MDDGLGPEHDGTRLYTVEGARAIRGHVVALLEQLRAMLTAYGAHWIQDPALSRLVTRNGHPPAVRPDLMPASTLAIQRVSPTITDITALHDEFIRLGVVLRDPMRGLIDLHHRRDGRIVYLCYQLGEDDFGYWHDVDAGFAGRQPL